MKNAFEITLGREYYSRQFSLMEWCRDNIGIGGWKYLNTETDIDSLDVWDWMLESVFGNSIFSFKTEEMRSKFKEFVLQS